MRKKEGLSDYRYFPEPDLPGVFLTQEYVDGIHNSLPELPEMKRRRYEKMGLSMQDVLFLANDMNVSPLDSSSKCLLYLEVANCSVICYPKNTAEVEIYDSTVA